MTRRKEDWMSCEVQKYEDWISREIRKYEEWEKSKNRVIFIPPELQVGKLLMSMSGNIDSCLKFIDHQVAHDSKSIAFWDGYWGTVKNYFLKCYIDALIMAE